MNLWKTTKYLAARHLSFMAREERGDLGAQPMELIPGMPAAPEPCTLAGAHWKPETHPKDAIGQYKVNGIRCLYIKGRMISRQALPLDCALHCMPALQRFEATYGQDMVIDGEYFSSSLENTLAEQKKGVGVGQFWIFDAVPYDEWAANKFTEKLRDRLKGIEANFLPDEPFIGLLNGWEMDVSRVIESANVVWAQGHEGLVVKDANALYYRGRTKDWQKVKQTHNAVGRILDAHIVDNRLKHLIVQVNGRAQKISAMPANLKDAIWRSETKWQGRQVDVQWNDETSTGRLQGARILRGVPRETSDA